MISSMNKPLLVPSMLAKTMEFSYDPDIGELQLSFAGELEFYNPLQQERQTKEWTQAIRLSPEVVRRFREALPLLQSLLEQAAKGPTKPRSVQ